MPGVFISYRREDTIAYAGRLYDRLQADFGKERVFIDIDTLRPGDDFIEALQRTVASCDVLVAVIGKQWLTAKDDKGQLRLDDPEDFVRLELEAALGRAIRVIPALVGGAQMPASSALPDSLKKLSRYQAVTLPDTGFQMSVNSLVQVVDAEIKAAQARTAIERTRPGQEPRKASASKVQCEPPKPWIKRVYSDRRLRGRFALWIAIPLITLAVLVKVLPVGAPACSTAQRQDYFYGQSKQPDVSIWHAPPEWRIDQELHPSLGHGRLLVKGPSLGYLLAPTAAESYCNTTLRFQVPIITPGNPGSVKWFARLQPRAFNKYHYRFMLTLPTDEAASVSAAVYTGNKWVRDLGAKIPLTYHPFTAPKAIVSIETQTTQASPFTFVIIVRYIPSCSDISVCPEEYKQELRQRAVFTDYKRALKWGYSGFIAPNDTTAIEVQEVCLVPQGAAQPDCLAGG